jgi:hypothetical protein
MVRPSGSSAALRAAFGQPSSWLTGHRLAGVFNKPQQVVSNPAAVAVYPRRLEFTGAPSKNYRGAQQDPVVSMTRVLKEYPAKSEKTFLWSTALPHCSPCIWITGVSNKKYRGAPQGLPGRPAKHTGAPHKDYRGVQQEVPGRPTRITGAPSKSFRQTSCKNGYFEAAIQYAVVLCLLYCYCLCREPKNRESKEVVDLDE